MYFSFFPQGTYDIKGNGIDTLVTDLMVRVKIRSKIMNEASLYDLYDIPEGETPEMTALKHFGSTHYHWIILLTNDITDRYYGWPLTTYEFEKYINDKYTNPDGVHHYEITQSSGKIKGEGPSDYEHKLIVNSTTPNAEAITNRDYEQRIQDQKRQIKLLDAVYLPIFIEEFENLTSQ
jgi:hypothetical protein